MTDLHANFFCDPLSRRKLYSHISHSKFSGQCSKTIRISLLLHQYAVGNLYVWRREFYRCFRRLGSCRTSGAEMIFDANVKTISILVSSRKNVFFKQLPTWQLCPSHLCCLKQNFTKVSSYISREPKTRLTKTSTDTALVDRNYTTRRTDSGEIPLQPSSGETRHF